MRELIEKTHSKWHDTLDRALGCMNSEYLRQLQREVDWLPGNENLFAAFSRPPECMKFLLLGESPYPRPQSANGYAFWDNAVGALFSDRGLSLEVNRATSLRNLIKMLLVARGDLQEDCSQTAIARLDKRHYIQTAQQLFNGMMERGFLLLNASLVYRDNQVPYHSRQWQPFMNSLFDQLAESHPSIQLVLFGKIAAQVKNAERFSCLVAEHPYNLSFINNPDVLAFFKPLDLLSCHERHN
ncbi:uracil-DNA glycosylase [Legionella sp. MW5194]|uniref:uracil-DNA glycosylase n=1 Tax=Legionella sp. MW5194 TaxID=2662448 RepID=UPI00193CE618|nr:uracil-DNA glycosylase [Legionella sp. MW5194]QRN03686.1 uracil-DNA glycosylase [Legionella sp. MW5194]